MKATVLSKDEYARIMSDWKAAEQATQSAAEASERYIEQHGHTSDELVEELVEAMFRQTQIMEQLKSKAHG